MSSSMPIEDSDHDEVVDSGDSSEAKVSPARPDWLMGAAEGAQRKPVDDSDESDAPGPGARPPAIVPLRLRDKEGRDQRPELRLVPAEETSPPAATEASIETASGPAKPEAWKAAASSVPKLRQKPAVTESVPDPDAFAGFAQDGIPGKANGRDGSGEAKPAAAVATPEAPASPAPLGGEPSVWVIWLDHLRFIRHPAVIIGACVLAVALVAANLLAPRVQEGDSVARIRQQPEAYEGRSVTVGGVAGESYAVGPNTAFNLYQGRDTIVVYSPKLRPRLHEKVRVTGTIGVGYLDGVARVSLLDDAKR